MITFATVPVSALDGYSVLVIHMALLFLLKGLCLLLGYLTIRLGYQLISSGAKGEFRFSGKAGDMQAALKSISPGLLSVLLGILLMGYAVGVKKVGEIPESKAKQGAKQPDFPLPSDFQLDTSLENEGQ